MFENILKELLEENDLTQAELAAKSGIPKTTINGWFKQGRKPDYLALQKLSDFFDVSVDYLCGKTDSHETSSQPQCALLKEQREILNYFDNLDKHNKAVLKAYIKGLYEGQRGKL